MIITKRLSLTREEYYEKHLLIINHILPEQMTPKEAKVLAAFMSLKGDIAEDPFGTSGRKIVRDRLGISPGGLGNYLDQLKNKNFIIDKDGVLTILPILIPGEKEQLYQFKLDVKDE